MSVNTIQETLKNMSGDELAQTQNAIVVAPDIHPAERLAAMELVCQEVDLRKSEGIGRKAGRLWKRHGDKACMVAVGVVLGDLIGD